MVGQVLGEAVDVEATYAGDVLAQVVAAAQAGGAGAAGQGGIGHDTVARHDAGVTSPDSDDLTAMPRRRPSAG